MSDQEETSVGVPTPTRNLKPIWLGAGGLVLVLVLVVSGAIAFGGPGEPGGTGDPGEDDGAPTVSASATGNDAGTATPSASATESADPSASAETEGDAEPTVIAGGPVTIGAPKPWAATCGHNDGLVSDAVTYINFTADPAGTVRNAVVHPGDEYRKLLEPGYVWPAPGQPQGGTPFTASVVEWSPNSRYVAWIERASGQLTIYDTQTGSSRDISGASTREDTQLAWTRDSSRLTYVAIAGDDATVVTVTVSNGASTSVLTDAHINGVAWSPDGDSIAVAHTAYQPGPIPQIKGSVVDIVSGSTVVHTGILGLSPAWSPDGTSLIFLGDADADGQWAAVRYVPSTAAATNITPELAFKRFLPGYWDRFTPAFSPDGSRLAVLAPVSDSYVGDLGVYVADADGAGSTVVSQLDSLVAPVWNPSGSKLIVTETGALAIYDADTGATTDSQVHLGWEDPVWVLDGSAPVVSGFFCDEMLVRAQVVTSPTTRAPINFGGGWIENTFPVISPDGTLAVADLRGEGVSGSGLYLFEMP